MRGLVTAVAVLVCAGCPGKSKNKPPTSGDGADPCAAMAPKVEGLYRALPTDSGAGDAGIALQADLLAANVHMVLKDCRTDPATFVPCLTKAQTVAEIESDCLVPLDDEGAGEGRAFGPKSP